MKQLNRTSRLVVIGAGLGAAVSASSGRMAQALRIHEVYLVAGVVAWYAFLIALFVRNKRATCR